VLIVAHRLATIIDSDRILVMSDGQAREYNHPYCLMVKNLGDESITRPKGYFAKMVLETDAETALSLFEMAHDSFKASNEKWPTSPVEEPVIEKEDSFFKATDSEDFDVDEGSFDVPTQGIEKKKAPRRIRRHANRV